MAVVRKSTLAALRLFAADGQPANPWTLDRLPDSLTEPERESVVRGCYEMLMVLAAAVAQPLPGESATAQAREALQILDRARRPAPPADPCVSPEKGRLPRAGQAISRGRNRSGRRPSASSRMVHSTTS